MSFSALAACSRGGEPTGSQSVAASASPSPLSAQATTSAVATAAPSSREARARRRSQKRPKSFEALKAELAKQCPVAEKESNIEQKGEASKAVDCLRRSMIADLDAVLLPLKSTDAVRFKVLMVEQAKWNRFSERACSLEEKRVWLDTETGELSDGTARGYAYMACLDKAYSERSLYARTFAAATLEPLVKRVDSAQNEGEAVKAAIAHLKADSARFVKSPPHLEEGAQRADWAAIGAACDEVGKDVQGLAKSSCETWPELAKALGGMDACLPKAELYYFAQALDAKASMSGE